MRRGERRLFTVVLTVLVLALAALVFQRVGGSGGPEIYRVSVLLDGTADEYWRNFRAGLDRAALERNVDLRFVTYYDENMTQADALRREWEGGETDGVVLVPAEDDALSGALEGAPAALAVVVAGPRLDLDRVSGYVSPGTEELAARLADEAERVGGGSCTLYLSPDPTPAAAALAERLAAELEGRGMAWKQVTAPADGLPPPERRGALAAVEPAVAEALCRQGAAAGRVCGTGVSGRLLRALEDGAAAALAVQSDYDAGYLALAMVTDRLAGRPVEDVTLDAYTATRDNMFGDPMVDILFAA